VTEPVHKRLNELQAHVGKHAMEKSEYGEEIKKNITDNENNTLRVFELHFETQEKLEDLKASHEQNNNQGSSNTNTGDQRNEQAQQTGGNAQQQSAPHSTVTRGRKLSYQELLDELIALRNGRSDGSFLYNYLGDRETAETYRKCFQPKHTRSYSDVDSGTPTQDAQPAASSQDIGTKELQELLDDLGLKRSGNTFNTRAAAFGFESELSLRKIARSLQQPVVQLDAPIPEDSMRADNSSIESLIENKDKVKVDEHKIIIKHTAGTFEAVEYKSNNEVVSQALDGSV